VTGGSLPVEIWSRFMRSAHQGVPVASLPGASTGNFFPGLFSGGVSSRPVPPAPVQPVAANNSATTGSGGLDGWLLNNLFGRR
jgi:penicillin-binding protein 1A